MKECLCHRGLVHTFNASCRILSIVARRSVKSQHNSPYSPKYAAWNDICTKASGLNPWLVIKFFPYPLNSNAWQSFWQIKSLILVSANRTPARSSGDSFHSSFFGVVSIRSSGGVGGSKNFSVGENVDAEMTGKAYFESCVALCMIWHVAIEGHERG
jgi:hypothetical protein